MSENQDKSDLYTIVEVFQKIGVKHRVLSNVAYKDVSGTMQITYSENGKVIELDNGHPNVNLRHAYLNFDREGTYVG